MPSKEPNYYEKLEESFGTVGAPLIAICVLIPLFFIIGALALPLLPIIIIIAIIENPIKRKGPRKSGYKLSFGLNDFPDNVTAVWGAEWEYPNIVIKEAQDFYGNDTDEGNKLNNWLNSGAISQAQKSAGNGIVKYNESRTVILYEDSIGIIKGNNYCSHRIYVCGYLKDSVQ